MKVSALRKGRNDGAGGNGGNPARTPAVSVHSARCSNPGAPSRYPPPRAASEALSKRARSDPKDGELCPARTKPGETLAEVRSGSDVQIDRPSWV